MASGVASVVVPPAWQFPLLLIGTVLFTFLAVRFAGLERALDRMKSSALVGALGVTDLPYELPKTRFALRLIQSVAFLGCALTATLGAIALTMGALPENGMSNQNRLLIYSGVFVLMWVILGSLTTLVRYRAEENSSRTLASARGWLRFWVKSGPLMATALRLSEGLRRLVRQDNDEKEDSNDDRVEDEIRTILEGAGEDENWSEARGELLESVLEFRRTVAREIMTPRVEVDSISVNAELEEVVKVVVESGHSRLPVFEENDDSIIGIIHAKDVLKAQLGEDRVPLRSLLREAMFVPETILLEELLMEMRVKQTQLAIVQDEFGGTAGVVSIEDIVEELVGEIKDEYDEDEVDLLLTSTEEGWEVDGLYPLSDLNEELGTRFENDEVDTLGGYVFGLFGRQPGEGEAIEDDGFRFTVNETDGRRIVRVGIVPLTAPETADEFALGAN
ncbi:MAG: HlyC/CorC family transporter [Fimbriimonadaceae bacterium]|nr:HlyC/CorC family transporter [Fimbriimonadaceae bacterium]